LPSLQFTNYIQLGTAAQLEPMCERVSRVASVIVNATTLRQHRPNTNGGLLPTSYPDNSCVSAFYSSPVLSSLCVSAVTSKCDSHR